jgi:hypothetical protein
MKIPSIPAILLMAQGFAVATPLSVNIDFSRDVSAGLPNPGTNPASTLYSSTGPAPTTGTVWNDFSISLAAAGDDGADSIDHPVTRGDLAASDGSGTAVGVTLTSGFYRAFNSTTPASGNDQDALQNERVFSRNNNTGIITISGLDSSQTYDLYFIASSFNTTFSVGAATASATGTINTVDGTLVWTAGGHHASLAGISPNISGEIAIGVTGNGQAFGAIAGMQIAGEFPVTPPVRFIYPHSITTTGGEFSSSYPPSNLMGDHFDSPEDLIDTRVNYLAAGNNHATTSGTTQNFSYTFGFDEPAELDGIHVWNYSYRNGGGGETSPTSGVNAYSLSFHDGPAGTGNPIGATLTGNLDAVVWNAANPAQTIWFPAPRTGVRSVVMQVLSNHGATGFSGLCEVGFNGAVAPPGSAITAFTASASWVQKPAVATLNWTITGTLDSLVISGIGDVTGQTTSGVGSIQVSPVGTTTYTLTLNGTLTANVTVTGLPEKHKVHLYLLIGQSNMQGAGRTRSATLDQPHPRVLKFGSRDNLESTWVPGDHPLTGIGMGGTTTGMGVEFGKTLLAAQSDPEVVIGLVNHALGSTKIQVWAPGVSHTTGTRTYQLYDEAVARILAASACGEIKGVLWHQGEYNSNTGSNPDAQPDLYASRLHALVQNLRNDLDSPGLPFVCGKLVPASWVNASGTTIYFTGLPSRAIVEGALADLPNQKSNSFCVDHNGLRGMDDEMIHFDSYSQRLLGQRYANAILDMQADPHRLYLGGFFTPAQLALPAYSDVAADVDADGIPSLLEFAFLTDPTAPDRPQPYHGLTVSIPGAGNFSALSFRRRLDSAAPDYLVEVSTDLQTWRSNGDGQGPDVTVEHGTPLANADGTETATIRMLAPVSGEDPQGFIRLRVLLP